MKRLTAITIMATVYCLGMGNLAKAAESKPPKFETKKEDSSSEYGPERIKQMEKDREEAAKIRKEDQCKADDKDLRDAYSKYTTACSDSRLGTEEQCITRVDDCAANTLEREHSTLDSMYGNMEPEEFDKSCPRSTNSAGNLEKKFKEERTEMKSLEKQTIEDAAKNAKDFSELQKDIAENDKDYEEAIQKSASDKEKEKVDVGEAMTKIASNIEKLHAQILKKQSERAKSQADKAARMANLANSVIKSNCLLELQGNANKIKSSSSSSAQGMIKSGANRNKILKESYQVCLQKMLESRKATIETFDNFFKELDYDIAVTEMEIVRSEKRIEDIKNSVKTANDMAAANGKMLEKNYTAKKMILANKLQNLMDKTKAQEQTNKKNLGASEMEMKQASSDLARIGGADMKDVKSTFSDVLNARKLYLVQYKNYDTARCCSSTGDSRAVCKQDGLADEFILKGPGIKKGAK